MGVGREGEGRLGGSGCMDNLAVIPQPFMQLSKMDVDSKDLSGCTPLLYCLNNKNKSLEKVPDTHTCVYTGTHTHFV